VVHFHAVGHIATDIVRRETSEGVTASFRFCSGIPGQSRLWITAEATGHTAGRIHTHGHVDRAVLIAGQLTQRTWRDRTTQQQRRRLVVLAATVELLPASDHAAMHNHTITHGRLTTDGDTDQLTLVTGRTGTTAGKIWLPISTWEHTRGTEHLTPGNTITIAGRLAYNKHTEPGHYHLVAQTLTTANPTPD